MTLSGKNAPACSRHGDEGRKGQPFVAIRQKRAMNAKAQIVLEPRDYHIRVHPRSIEPWSLTGVQAGGRLTHPKVQRVPSFRPV
ncbi:hypothetical protein C9I57_22775 [Trinickia symbiotica]|uniref:Uncharacterized protein n=1 Tax=Trinickia symbiotica TaxID=863227 RepID=A0A2T3XPJ3_9BURK|nr:hypothetical protein C9I57_22775 [Trinickia symbiotica]